MEAADEALLSKVPARRYPMDGDACDAGAYEDLLRERFEDELWFDFAVHGLGPDGHTASLFPGRPEVGITDRWVVEVPEAGWEPFVPRMSLTVPALSSASVGVFLVTGEDKREPLQRLLKGDDIPADRALYEALRAGNYEAWRNYPLSAIEDSGQQEVLNWMCLAGALYTDLHATRMPRREELELALQVWNRAHVLANDMETSTIFVICALRNLRGGSVLTVVNEPGEEAIDPARVAALDLAPMFRVALAGARQLAPLKA